MDQIRVLHFTLHSISITNITHHQRNKMSTAKINPPHIVIYCLRGFAQTCTLYFRINPDKTISLKPLVVTRSLPAAHPNCTKQVVEQAIGCSLIFGSLFSFFLPSICRVLQHIFWPFFNAVFSLKLGKNIKWGNSRCAGRVLIFIHIPFVQLVQIVSREFPSLGQLIQRRIVNEIYQTKKDKYILKMRSQFIFLCYYMYYLVFY